MRLSAALVAVAVLLAGCTSASDKPGPTDSGPTTSAHPPVTTTPGPGGDPGPGGNVTLQTLRFEGCLGSIPTIDVPAATAEPHIPEGFSGEQFIPEFQGIYLFVLNCPRVVAPDRILENIAMLVTFAGVKPDNSSWENESAISSYVYDVLASDQAVLDYMAAMGNSNLQAVEFDETITPVSDGFAHNDWIFRNEKVSFQVGWTYPTDRETFNDTYERHFWTGSNPFHRFDIHQVDEEWVIFSNAQGSVVAQGESEFADMMVIPASFQGAGAFQNLTWDFQLIPKEFALS